MISFARWDMRAELAELWKASFGEPERFPRYFLNNCFRPRNSLVYLVGETVVSAVYLLPARVAAPKGTVRAHYIFAAATLPQYRSRGYMASLLACAAMVGPRRGESYSVLLPAEPGLADYYGKLGYLPFYKARSVEASYEDLEKLAGGARLSRMVPVTPRLNSLRNTLLQKKPGSLLWDDRMFHFAVGLGAAYGDRLVCRCEGSTDAYVLCRKGEDETCGVLELMAGPESFPGLVSALLREVPAQRYRFRLPVGCGPFPGEGKMFDFGMIRPIGGASLTDVTSDAPYLGLGMD